LLLSPRRALRDRMVVEELACGWRMWLDESVGGS
jgi:hypothetical protein